MSAPRKISMVIGATGTSASVIPSYSTSAVFIGGTFTGSLQVQATIDGTNWVNVGSALTSPGYVVIPTCTAVRVNGTPTGTPTATLVYQPY